MQGTDKPCSLKRFQVGVLAVVGGLMVGEPAIAQIIPDRTLSTPSVVNAPACIQCTITGGTVSGNNLFHSFQEFSVPTGGSAWFNNPATIQTIFTRVTGSQRSTIDGLLKTNGTASLFFLNPNGILFGSNARLDVRGAFLATTATSFQFPDGSEFSATNPQPSPLLTVSITPGLQYGAPATLTQRGTLAAGQDLTLAAGYLDVRGQMSAGRNLTLYAQESVTIRDSTLRAFRAEAGAALLVQGNQAVDIFALNHPASGFFAGGDLVVRSAGAIAGDAHFTTGGNFRIEQLTGALGSWASPNDPVIRASGDVSFTSYTGASLHILAGGSVTADSITITGADTTTGLVETITLSDGTTSLAINGQAQPTLDIRAGTGAVGTPLGQTGVDTPTGLVLGTVPGSANIAIGSITLNQPNGLVYLSNQYQPTTDPGSITVGNIFANDPTLSGNGSRVVVDSRGALTVNGLIDTSSADFVNFLGVGNGGDITLLSVGDLTVSGTGALLSYGELGGSITLKSQANLSVTGTGNTSFFPIDSYSLTFSTNVKGGDINLEAAQTLALTNAGSVVSRTFDADSGNVTLRANTLIIDGSEADAVTLGLGNGGDVTVVANQVIQRNRGNLLAVTGFDGRSGNVLVTANTISLDNESQTGSLVLPGATGDAGNVTFEGRSLSVTQGSQIVSTTFGAGNAGNISLTATESILFDGVSSGGGFSSAISAAEFDPLTGNPATGKGGTTTVTTNTLSLSNGAQLRAVSVGPGDAGDIQIKANTITLDGIGSNGFPTAISSTVLDGATGNGGDITIAARSLQVTNGASISANTTSPISTPTQGNAGNIDIDATDWVLLDGSSQLSSGEMFASEIRAETFGVGNAGQLTIATSNLTVSNNAQLIASTSPTSSGNGGTVELTTANISILNNAAVSVSSRGTGTGGNIQIQTNALTLDTLATLTAETASADGGNISIQARDFVLLRRNSLISTTAGTAQAGGNGGNIDIRTNFLLAVLSENSDIAANAFTGNGGRVDLTAQGIVGIQARLQQTPESDIIASSQFGVAGVVTINTPNLDPSRGLTELPEGPVDASQLIAQNCSPRSGATSKQGEFIQTGRGGLPAAPGDGLTSQSVWQDLRPTTPPASSTRRSTQQGGKRLSDSTPIVEAQQWIRDRNGQVALVAPNISGNESLAWPSVQCTNAKSP